MYSAQPARYEPGLLRSGSVRPMSHPVDLDELDAALRRYGSHAFLMTTSDDLRPHISHVTVELAGGMLTCGAGRKTGANASVRPMVSLLWPAPEEGEFSLILDGDATLDGDVLRVTPTGAIRHRPASNPDCTVDCEPLTHD